MNLLAEITSGPALPAYPTPYEIGAMSTQQLRASLAQQLTITAHTLGHLALIWRELENRGEDLSDLRVGLAAFLPMIAANQLDANVVVRFAGQPSLLKAVAALPVPEQKNMAEGKLLTVLSANTDGEIETTQIPATALTPTQVRLVFDAGRLRSEEEQRALLSDKKLKQALKQAPGASTGVHYNPKTDSLHVGRARAKLGEVLAAITNTETTPSTIEELDKTLMLHLTSAEHAGLVVRAGQARMTMQDFARRLLVSKALV